MKKIEDFVKEEGDSFPGKTYVEELLKPVFNDQRDYLFDAMFALHRAHVIMLNEQSLLSDEDTETILKGINDLTKVEKESLKYQPEYEDLFFTMESKLGDIIGHEIAGKLHIARSRNDMGEGMYRFVLRDNLLSLIKEVDNLLKAFLEQSEVYVDSVMPAHTHTQPAQPTTFGHWLLAIHDNLQRDRNRLVEAYKTVNKSPLGAAAITTTGFSIDRNRLAELLGFEDLMENSYDAIGAGDYLLESAQAIESLMINAGRWIQEFLRLVTNEVGLIKVSSPYVQISSIMPQKRNPVSIEHSRALASNAVGKANSIIQMLHNVPYGDVVDTEDDLQPSLYDGFDKATRALRLMFAVVRTMEFNEKLAEEQAYNNLIVITELADVLTRDYKVSFRKSHTMAATVAQKSDELGKELYEWKAHEINEILEEIKLSELEWSNIVNPNVFVERRSIQGGPSHNEAVRMIENRKKQMNKNESLLQSLRQNLKDSKSNMHKIIENYEKCN